jgi:hypothetical protein
MLPCLARAFLRSSKIRGLVQHKHLNSGQVFAVAGRTGLTLLLARRLCCRPDVLTLVCLTYQLLPCVPIRRPEDEVRFAGIGSLGNRFCGESLKRADSPEQPSSPAIVRFCVLDARWLSRRRPDAVHRRIACFIARPRRLLAGATIRRDLCSLRAASRSH